MSKHVYILGAGFSVPLGGPLFTQLLTAELQYLNDALKIDLAMRESIHSLHQAKRQRNRQLDLMLGRVHRPFNAEELLDLIDWSSRNADKPLATLVYRNVAPNSHLMSFPSASSEVRAEFLSTLDRLLKRVVACQCQAFVDNLLGAIDATSAYRSWMQSLDFSDTIITFNYDTAVETLAAVTNATLMAEPGYRDRTATRLLKLHGSVNWHRVDGRVVENNSAYLSDLDLCIATPGLAKAQIIEIPEFEKMWGEARKAIQHADTISIIGYSMPATDNFARQWLLDSMQEGQRVNLVLGPDMLSKVSQRMVSMIQPIVQPNNSGKERVDAGVVDLRMYAQDYLAAVHRYERYRY